ncbi:MAG: hypothetical protein IJS46_03985, partial [Kiritimatiellae bacterium]|nr:hypothetical protein [Kiritimatiellia bacterium]
MPPSENSKPSEKFDFTLNEIRTWGGDRLFDEAMSRYVDQGSVANVTWDGMVCSAEVNHAGHVMNTSFRADSAGSGLVSNLCPCITSRRDGRICVHMLAAAITLAKEAA